ncbi:MAG TPA: gamma-glutamyltransferase [Candidatus Polarisedimenticolia bacterium]|nr:gamma-glutamyltransferase [Candidatus Polarisedimenticolia bacterium]
MRARLRVGALLAACGAAALCAPAAWPASRPAERARHAMIAGPEPVAVEEGLRVLGAGGNAVDAAVTMAFVLAVTYPQAGNLGGGGYMLVSPARGEPYVVDFRETAPAAAERGMFLDAEGRVVPRLSLDTYKGSGVPGTVAGLALALRKGGSRSWRDAIEPAIRAARRGFAVPRGLEEDLLDHAPRLERWPASRAVFFKDGRPVREGEILAQPDLAATLETLALEGPDAFYRGAPARALAADMRAHGGLIDEEDLAGYRAIERPPLRGEYRGFTVLTVPPSSSGGVVLLQTLAMLGGRPIAPLGHNSSATIHLVSEALRRAFADRAHWLGDPAFTTIPLPGLVSPAYAASRLRDFDPSRATLSSSIRHGDPEGAEPGATTHFSVLDRHGGAVSTTVTLNELFGSGAVAGRLGYLLNDEMDDFSAAPGTPNLFGLVGSEANAIAPGKRMLSSMCPTILLEKEAGRRPGVAMVLGSPGGPAIITSVLQAILNVVDFRMELQAAVDAPRFHHQWLPDQIALDEGAFPADVIEALRRRGHHVVERAPRGDVQAILVDRDQGWILGASDPRRYGVARGE